MVMLRAEAFVGGVWRDARRTEREAPVLGIVGHQLLLGVGAGWLPGCSAGR
jgi:hypothetical protein